jgi:hypothetical protein
MRNCHALFGCRARGEAPQTSVHPGEGKNNQPRYCFDNHVVQNRVTLSPNSASKGPARHNAPKISSQTAQGPQATEHQRQSQRRHYTLPNSCQAHVLPSRALACLDAARLDALLFSRGSWSMLLACSTRADDGSQLEIETRTCRNKQ